MSENNPKVICDKPKVICDNPKVIGNKKICRMCNIVKDLDNDFYDINKSKSKYCKPCHNSNRKKYKFQKPKPKIREKKPTGFNKLPKEIQDDILYMLSIKYTFKEIAEKYKEHLKYKTLCTWKRQNKIPIITEQEKDEPITDTK
jgi:hypothetical protein